MIDIDLYTDYPYYGAYTVDDLSYDPDKPRLKDLFWQHYSWLVEMDRSGKSRPAVLDNIQKALLCNTVYLGYDGFECPECGNEMLFFRGSLTLNHSKQFTNVASMPHFLMEILSNILHLYIVLYSII